MYECGVWRLTCAGQRSASAVFLNCSPTCFLRKCVSLSLELTNSARPASQQVPGILLFQHVQSWDLKHSVLRFTGLPEKPYTDWASFLDTYHICLKELNSQNLCKISSCQTMHSSIKEDLHRELRPFVRATLLTWSPTPCSSLLSSDFFFFLKTASQPWVVWNACIDQAGL